MSEFEQDTPLKESIELLSLRQSDSDYCDQETQSESLEEEVHFLSAQTVNKRRNKMEVSQIQFMTKRNWINIVLLGFGFMLLFTAFQTSAFVQTITLNSFLAPHCQSNNTTSSSTYVDGGITISEEFSSKLGYYSLCLIYLMVALGNWLSIPVVAVFGARLSLIITGFLYVVYIGALVRPYVPVIFIGAFLLGSAGGILWTAQGQILIQNSSKSKMALTSGIFWFMLQTSLIYGNLFFFVFLNLQPTSSKSIDLICITHSENYIIFGVFTVLGLLGVGFFVLLWLINIREKGVEHYSTNKPAAVNDGLGEENTLLSKGTSDYGSRNSDTKAACLVAARSLVRAVKLLFSVDMMLLSVTFIYTGYELNFWSGVYGTAVGRTGVFSRADVGLAGLFIGLGEIIGGGLFGILGRYTNRWGKDPVVLLGMLAHFAVYLLVYYNLPDNASVTDVPKASSFGALIKPSNIYVVMVCAFMLGLGDACFNTQIYSIIGKLYPSDADSAPAMALFKFFQSLAAMIGFLTSSLIMLQWQLIALVVLATAGTLTFAVVEWKHHNGPSPKIN